MEKNKQVENIEAITPQQEIKETEKRYSVTLKTIEELGTNKELYEAFKKTAEENPEMKAPIIMQFAKAMLKQQKLAI